MIRSVFAPFTCSLLAIFQLMVPALAADAPGDRIFGTTKVVPLHLTMSPSQFEALAPANSAPFSRRGGGGTRAASDDAHRNTFGVEIGRAHV